MPPTLRSSKRAPAKAVKADTKTSAKRPIKKKTKLPELIIVDDEVPDLEEQDAVRLSLLPGEIAVAIGAAEHSLTRKEEDRRQRAKKSSEAAAEKVRCQDSARISILLVDDTFVKVERQIQTDAARVQRDAAAKDSAHQWEVWRCKSAVILAGMLFRDSIRAGVEARISDRYATKAAEEAKLDAACMAALLKYESNNPVQIPWRNLKNDNGDFVISKFRRRYDPVPQSFLHLLPGELRNQIYKTSDPLGKHPYKLEMVSRPPLARAIPDLATEIYTWMFMHHAFEVDVFSKLKAAYSLHWPITSNLAHGVWEYGVVMLDEDHWIKLVDPRAVCFRKVSVTVMEADLQEVCKISLDGRPTSRTAVRLYSNTLPTTRQRFRLSEEEVRLHATAVKAQSGFRGFMLHDLSVIARAFRDPDKKVRDALKALNVVSRQS